MRVSGADVLIAIVAVSVGVLLAPSAALAHAERQSSEPAAGRTLAEPPRHLYINFSEPPTGDSVITVVDGCGNDVVDDFDVTDRTIHATLLAGQPGRYKVATKVVSGLDGHPTRDGWSFEVEGARDCSAPPPQAEAGDEEPPEEDGGGGGSTMLLAAAGVAALIGIAATIRLRSK
ncbi:MAG: copper resistance CopC family protein [Actinomycetota bacterium]